MKIVLLLSGREALPKGLFEAACALNKQEPILLTGVFMPKATYQNTLWYYSGGAEGILLDYEPVDAPVIIGDQAIGQFKKLCGENGIEYRVHENDESDIIQSLKRETRFADLLLLSNEASEHPDDADTGPLRDYAGDTLHYSECPVLIISKDFRQPQSVILAYDGSPASVFAIKQFAMLMPQMTSLETVLVYMNADPKTDLPDKKFIEDLAGRHFSHLTICKINLGAEMTPNLLNADKKETLLVTGSFSRSGISRVFKSSFAHNLLKAQEMTVFIAHK